MYSDSALPKGTMTPESYRAHRFVVRLISSVERTEVLLTFTPAEVHSTREGLEVSINHRVKQPSIVEMARKCTVVEVWLIQGQGQKPAHARCVRTNFAEVIWLPLDLRGSSAGYAAERVLFTEASYTTEDFEQDKIPEGLL